MRISFFPSLRIRARLLRRHPLLVIFALAAASTAFAAHPKLTDDLQDTRGDARVNVIVQFTTPVRQQHLDRVIARGGAHKATLNGVQGASFSLPASALKHVADDSEVALISLDHKWYGVQTQCGVRASCRVTRPCGAATLCGARPVGVLPAPTAQ